MEGIDLLQSLNEQRSTLGAAVANQEVELNNRLFDFFKTITEFDGLEMMPIHCDIRTPSGFREDKGSFEVHLKIEYYNEKGETWKDGSPKADFASDIDLYIYSTGLEMNYGTCGKYSRKDKGLMTRAMFIPKLWENEDAIIAICKAVININDYKELIHINRQIEDINYSIMAAKREKERQEVLNKIRSAKYLAKARKQEINGHWEMTEDGKIDHWTCDGYERVYYSLEEIKKVTDTNVLTREDEYWHDNHRRNLNQVISDIRNGSLFLLNEKIDKEPLPEEVPAE